MDQNQTAYNVPLGGTTSSSPSSSSTSSLSYASDFVSELNDNGYQYALDEENSTFGYAIVGWYNKSTNRLIIAVRGTVVTNIQNLMSDIAITEYSSKDYLHIHNTTSGDKLKHDPTGITIYSYPLIIKIQIIVAARPTFCFFRNAFDTNLGIKLMKHRTVRQSKMIRWNRRQKQSNT